MLVFNDDVTTGFSKTSLEPISTLTFKGHGDKRNTCNNCDKRNSRHTCSNKTHDGIHGQIHDKASTTRIDPQNKPWENVPILGRENEEYKKITYLNLRKITFQKIIQFPVN